MVNVPAVEVVLTPLFGVVVEGKTGSSTVEKVLDVPVVATPEPALVVSVSALWM